MGREESSLGRRREEGDMDNNTRKHHRDYPPPSRLTHPAPASTPSPSPNQPET